jgi:hypothetical protein
MARVYRDETKRCEWRVQQKLPSSLKSSIVLGTFLFYGVCWIHKEVRCMNRVILSMALGDIVSAKTVRLKNNSKISPDEAWTHSSAHTLHISL